MRQISHNLCVVAPCLLLAFTTVTNAVSAAGPTVPEQAIIDATEQNQPIFLMFYKEQNTAGDQMAAILKSHPAVKSQQARWTAVRVTDPQERAIAEKFKVTRAPMPTVVAVYPNGAITGVFPGRVNPAQLSSCLVSPKASEMLKLLQDNQLVFVCVQTQARQALPAAVGEFAADPHFSDRVTTVQVSANDPSEASFLQSMGLNPDEISQTVVFLAPPGVHVGTYPAAVSRSELTEALAAAGKCCNDKNCKHNKPNGVQSR